MSSHVPISQWKNTFWVTDLKTLIAVIGLLPGKMLLSSSTHQQPILHPQHINTPFCIPLGWPRCKGMSIPTYKRQNGSGSYITVTDCELTNNIQISIEMCKSKMEVVKAQRPVVAMPPQLCPRKGVTLAWAPWSLSQVCHPWGQGCMRHLNIPFTQLTPCSHLWLMSAFRKNVLKAEVYKLI